MRSYGQFCGLARALDKVGQRWTLLIVRELLLGPKRFTDLRDSLPGMATNLLADRLRQLRDDGLVRQREMSPPSGSMVYELTEVGESLRPVVQELIHWGGRWMLEGCGKDVFRGTWLGLALEALGAGRGLEGERVIRFEMAAGATTLLLGTERVIAVDAEPELVIRGDPALILGVAAGAIDSSSADALDVDPPGEASTALLSSALAPAGSAEQTAVIGGPIQWRLNVPAPRERVHDALSNDEGRRRFWAETRAEADGRILFVFPNGGEYEGTLLESRPPELFEVEYFGGVARFELTADGRGGTDLHLTHTGQRGEQWIETHAGWLSVLLMLKAMVTHGVDLRTRDPWRSWDHGFVDG
jgi:DNA-binding HxlR family transcriptional regulator/uncharacterized protein YndB with AHSA1/START domain